MTSESESVQRNPQTVAAAGEEGKGVGEAEAGRQRRSRTPQLPPYIELGRCGWWGAGWMGG